MATSSIHIEAGNGGYFDHNSRERETANAIFDDEENFCSVDKKEAFEVYRSELKIRSEAYTDRTGQKLQTKAVTHLSAIVNFNKEHTPEDMKRVCDLLERKFDTKVIQYAMHRDEGHLNEDGTPDKNYHAHIEFMGLNSQGESIRRQLTRATLSELQSEVAKELGMERGRSTTYTKDQYKLITADLKKPEEYASKKEYNKAFRERALELNIHKPKSTKRLDTYDYKFHQQEKERAVKEAVLATQKELKTEMAKLREQLQQAGAGRAEYAALEQLNRELKEQIKAKDLTIDQLKERTDQGQSISEKYATLPIKERLEMRAEMREVLGENDELKSAKEEIKALKEAKAEPQHEPINATLIVQLQDENKLLKILNQGLETDLKEAKSATVSVPSVDVEPIREILRTATINDQSPSNDEIIKRRKEIEDLKAYNGKRIIEASKETTALGSITGAKKLDEALLQRNIDKILTLHFKAHESGDKLIDKFHRAKEAIIDGTKSLIKRAETTLEAFFSKKAGDLSSTPKKELVEQLQRTIRSREEILKDAKALSQDFYDKLKGQGKEKEPEPTKSRGIDFGGR